MYGNPHSQTHAYGWESAEVVDTARDQVAGLIGAHPKEIIFTSGATESNNMAIKGVARFYHPKKNHVITTVTEHKCVLDSCRWLQQNGFEVTYLPVGTDGLVDIEVRAARAPARQAPSAARRRRAAPHVLWDPPGATRRVCRAGARGSDAA